MSLFHVYFAAYVCQAVILHQDQSISTSLLWLVRYCHPRRLFPTAPGRMVIPIESLLGLTVHATVIVEPFSVHSTIISTNALISQAGTYYVIANYYLIWNRSQLYLVTQMISLLLHLTSAPPQSCVITMISL